MRRRRLFRIAMPVALLLAALTVYVVYRSATPLPLPDAADIEQRLAASVAAAEPLETVLESFWQSGFACTANSEGTEDGTETWYCDLAEDETEGRPATAPLECPERVMISLRSDGAGRLAGYAVSAGAFCL